MERPPDPLSRDVICAQLCECLLLPRDPFLQTLQRFPEQLAERPCPGGPAPPLPASVLGGRPTSSRDAPQTAVAQPEARALTVVYQPEAGAELAAEKEAARRDEASMRRLRAAMAEPPSCESRQ